MGNAIIGGLFAVGVSLLSWALSNTTRRARLLARVERQVQVLAALPDEHPARPLMAELVTTDVTAMHEIALPRHRGGSVSKSRPRVQVEVERHLRTLVGATGIAVLIVFGVRLVQALAS